MFSTHADFRSLWQCFRTVNPLVQAALLPKASICTGLRFHSNLISNNSPRAKRLGTLDNSKNRQLSSRARRRFSTTAIVRHGRLSPPKAGEELHITFVDKDGIENNFEVAEGDNLLEIAHSNDLEMEGACEGTCSCSTCHVIVESDEMFDKIPEASDDENDMLDLAFGLTETSRLGCQVKMTKELDGLRVKLPRMTRNMQKSDFVDSKLKGDSSSRV